MSWNVVQKLVEGVGAHSTLIGKFWINSFLLLRFLLVIAIAKGTWSDSSLVCNTLSPGCKNVCINEFSPILPIRFWMFQLLAVAMMSIVFMVYTTHKLALVTRAIKQKRDHEESMEKKEAEMKAKLRKLKSAEGGEENLPEKEEKVKVNKAEDPKVVATRLDSEQPSKLYLSYFIMALLRLLVEVAFMVAQYHLYTFKFVVPELFRCQHWPCPNVVDCFVSRPKEKTIMVCIFYCTGCVMIMLGVIEIFQLGGNLSAAWKKRHLDVTKEVFGDDSAPMFDGGQGNLRYWAGVEGMYEMSPQGYPDVAGIPTLVPRQQMPSRYRTGMRKNRRR